MAIDPRIILGLQGVNTGQALGQGRQSLQSVLGLQQAQQQQALGQQALQSGQLQLQQQQAQQQQIAEAREFKTNIQPFIASDPFTALANVQNSTVLDDEDKQQMISAINAEAAGNPAPLQALTQLTDRALGGGQRQAFQKGATTLVETGEGPAFATQAFDPRTGEVSTKISQINAKLISKLGETGQEQTIRKIEEAKGRADVKGISGRAQKIITDGLAAADSTAPIRRGIQLLEGLSTGGVDRVSFAAKQLLGVESADEGELSNLMGKAVLSQLKNTFGAAFTAQEARQLTSIEAGIGKSPAANKRLLENALKIAERSAKRAVKRAVDSDDPETARDILDALAFDLGELPQAPQAAPQAPAAGNALTSSGGIQFTVE